MRHKPIKNKLFIENRKRLAALLTPKSLAVVNANDLLPVNADATLVTVSYTHLRAHET